MAAIPVLAALAMLLLLGGRAGAGEFESPSNRSASEILPVETIKGPHYRIRDKVVSYGYLHHYIVDSDFGTFKVVGDGALRKLLKEIQAIAALRETKKSKAYAAAVKNAAKAPLDFGKNLITEPVATVTGIPKGVFGLFENIATNITETRDPSEDARAKQILAVSSYKREYAYKLGVDVYSSNPVLQEELNSVGWAGALGGLTVTAVMFPAQAPVIKMGRSMRLGNQLNEVLKEEPPARLRLINEKKLLAMGISADLTKMFLDHPAYTPRHDTIIVESLTRLKGASGRDAFLRFALSAEWEESANICQDIAETMRGYHEKVSPITEVSLVAGEIVAKAKNGSTLAPFPMDHGVWTWRADMILNGIVSHHKASGSKGKVEMWVTGTLSPTARERVEALGVKVTENVDERIEFID